jgi:tetrahydrodipicolinate N-succinyltransferase
MAACACGLGRGQRQPAQGRRQIQHCTAAIIVKKVDAQTRAKTSLNDLLRD